MVVEYKLEVVEWNIDDIGQSAAQVLNLYQNFPDLGTNSWGCQEEFLRQGITSGQLDEASFLGNGFYFRYFGPEMTKFPTIIDGHLIWEVMPPGFIIDPIPNVLSPREAKEFRDTNDFLTEYIENLLIMEVYKDPWKFIFSKDEYAWRRYLVDGLPQEFVPLFSSLDGRAGNQ